MKIEIRNLDEINPQDLVRHANDPLISRYLRDSFPYPYTINNALGYISYALKHNTFDFGIVVNGECIGCIGLEFKKDIYSRDCEIGYWIGRQYWGQGISTKVIHMMCEYLFSNFPVHKIYAEVFDENKASSHILEKNGFYLEGFLKEHAYKNGKYYDIRIYALKESDYGH